MNAYSRPALLDLLSGIEAAAGAPVSDRLSLVARALARHATDPTLLMGRSCPSRTESYTRHLLHADPDGRYAVVALVWRPGQMSPVHAHRAWCALAIHRGVLIESFYRPAEGEGPPVPVAAEIRRPGEVSQGPADPRMIHRLANLGCEEAISIHAYGMAFERFSTELNMIYGR